MPQQTPPILKTVALSRKYRDCLALDHLDLEVRAGEVFGYVGPNGAGKTTTFRILCGLLDPTSGSAHIDGQDVTGNKDRIKQLVGYLPDNFGVYPTLRVWEYLDFFAAAYRIPRKDRAKRVDRCLQIANAVEFKDKLMGSLSRGMKQRVGIAKTLIHDPQVIILDEPAATIDPRARIQMRQLLRDLARLGKAVLVSSHILPELADVCDRVGILSQGRMIACGAVAEVMRSVRQARVIEIHTAGAAEAARQVLTGAPGTWKVLAGPGTNGTLRYQVQADDQQLVESLRLLSDQRIPVISFTEIPPDLEEAFMTLTR